METVEIELIHRVRLSGWRSRLRYFWSFAHAAWCLATNYAAVRVAL